MPVDTATLKTFAPAMRRQLIEAVGRQLDLLLHSQTPDTLATYAKQIAELRQQEQSNRKDVLERVAYSWFNRLAALRYLDARGWHPFGCKVLMPETEGETQPELLKLMRSGSLSAELSEHTKEARLHGLLDGQIPTAIAGADPQGEVYRELVLATCRYYHQLLPNLFEALDDASELLLPDDLLTDGSIAAGFRSAISDEDCQDVEILGWLYQFYISEKKDEVMARKKAVPSEDIPAVTQLFTPHWIVRYLVENSLGRLWLLNRPGSRLRDQMPYYIEGETDTDFLRITKPEEIKLLDPACGSGHMLTYAFDLLSHIYTEEGYSASEIPGLILQHNLYGLDICPRAAQLAGLALVLKAREQSRRFFQPGQLVRPQIIELRDVRFAEDELNDYIDALDLGELLDPNLFKLLHQFEDAKTFGSLIQPCLDERAIANVRRAIEAKDLGGQLFLRETHLKALHVLEQSEALTQRYHVVVANPPYMESGKFNADLKSFAAEQYEASSGDLYQIFIGKSMELLHLSGFAGLVTKRGWMFIGGDLFRRKLLSECGIVALLDIGYNCFPEMNSKQVLAAAFVLSASTRQRNGIYMDLNVEQQSADKEAVFLESLNNRAQFLVAQCQFLNVRNSPLAYWLSDKGRELLNGRTLGDDAVTCQGLITGNNSLFIRSWHEVSRTDMNTIAASTMDAKSSGCKWFPISKGGNYRKWYGNNELVANWQDDGEAIKSYGVESGRPKSRVQNHKYYFRQGVTWSTFTSSPASFRVLQASLFESKGSACFANESTDPLEILSALNSCVARSFLRALCPTLDYKEGPMARVPLARIKDRRLNHDITQEMIVISKTDWDSFETSWDFAGIPFLDPGLKQFGLEASWRNWEAQSGSAIRRMQELETENNRLFIAAYGLEGELQPEVPEAQITLSRADARKDMAAFLSYAVGCMMGRYSLDQAGLILADASDTVERYFAKVGMPIDQVSFPPDEDAIIPVLDGEWFEDDIVTRSREFLKVAFPHSRESENLHFLEKSLGKEIRKYFCSDFYKDHLKTYKNRPIYWLVQSPKKGFSCLIYLHRYTKDTLNLVLNRYVQPYIKKLEDRLPKLDIEKMDESKSASHRAAARKEADKIAKALRDCQDWERDALLPLAQQRIELDLDDGVKVNYLKLNGVLAPIPGLAAKGD
jgi:hypothetical protein